MSRFIDTTTKVVFSVDDSKDERYSGAGYQPAPPVETKASRAKALAALAANKPKSD